MNWAILGVEGGSHWNELGHTGVRLWGATGTQWGTLGNGHRDGGQMGHAEAKLVFQRGLLGSYWGDTGIALGTT